MIITQIEVCRIGRENSRVGRRMQRERGSMCFNERRIRARSRGLNVKGVPIKTPGTIKVQYCTVCIDIAICGKLHKQMLCWQRQNAVRNSISKETSTYVNFVDVPLVFNKRSAESLKTRGQLERVS